MKILTFFFCALALSAVWSACLRDIGYKAGWKDGYLQGRKDADNWWLGVESETDQARQKIWKEEG